MMSSDGTVAQASARGFWLRASSIVPELTPTG